MTIQNTTTLDLITLADVLNKNEADLSAIIEIWQTAVRRLKTYCSYKEERQSNLQTSSEEYAIVSLEIIRVRSIINTYEGEILITSKYLDATRKGKATLDEEMSVFSSQNGGN